MREQSPVQDAFGASGWGRVRTVGFFNNLLADEVGVESIQRLDGQRFNLVVDDRAACLP